MPQRSHTAAVVESEDEPGSYAEARRAPLEPLFQDEVTRLEQMTSNR
jgi:hypothetical protein